MKNTFLEPHFTRSLPRILLQWNNHIHFIKSKVPPCPFVPSKFTTLTCTFPSALGGLGGTLHQNLKPCPETSSIRPILCHSHLQDGTRRPVLKSSISYIIMAFPCSQTMFGRCVSSMKVYRSTDGVSTRITKSHLNHRALNPLQISPQRSHYFV